jgi:hypothetical protein
LENHVQLKALVEGWTSQHKIDDIVTLLLENRVRHHLQIEECTGHVIDALVRAAQIPACPIKELADVANDPHVAHDRKMIVEVEVRPDLALQRSSSVLR